MEQPRELVLIVVAAGAGLVAVAAAALLVAGVDGATRIGQIFTLLGALLTMSSMLILIRDRRKKRQSDSPGERRD